MFLIDDLLAVLNKARSFVGLSTHLREGQKFNLGLISKQFIHANFHKSKFQLFEIPYQRNLVPFLPAMMRKCFSLL